MKKSWPAYSCPLYPRPNLLKRDDEKYRDKIAVTASPTVVPPNAYQWIWKMLDRATFPFIDPIILCYGHSDKIIDAVVVNWATANWHTMWMYYHRKFTEGKSYKNVKEEILRNERMLDEADFLIAFTDGTCDVTKQMIKEAKSRRIKVKVFSLN